MFRYTALRFGLIVACFGVIWGLVRLHLLPSGLGDSNYLWVVLLALVVSAPLSFVLLRGPREQAAVQVSQRVERARMNFAANTSAEDAADDADREDASRESASADAASREGEPHTA